MWRAVNLKQTSDIAEPVLGILIFFIYIQINTEFLGISQLNLV